MSSAAESGYRYPGSRPFHDTPWDRKLFRGRDEEAHELFHLTMAEKLVLVFANSGLGKSSLINAGLLELLREKDFFPAVVRINDPEAGPVRTLYRDVEEAIRRRGIELLTTPGGRLETEYGLSCQGPLPEPGMLSTHCFRHRVPLWLFFQEAEFWRGDLLCDPVLIIDQFEELFTLQGPRMREAFIEELANLARDRAPRSRNGAGELRGPHLKILLSLREDWLGSLEELVPKIPGILSTRFRLAPLRKDQAREAIEQPAALDDASVEAASFSYAPEAVDAILDFLSQRRLRGEMVPADEVAPSQLQIICQHLEGIVRRPGHGPEITLADLGGRREKVPQILSGVLEKYYDEQTAKVAHGRRRRAVRRLCETGLIVDGRRASCDEAALMRTFGVTPQELRKLADSHLLRAVPRLDSVYYELSHDTLVKPIQAARERRRRRRNDVLNRVLLVLLLAAALAGIVGWGEFRSARLRQSALNELVPARESEPLAYLISTLEAVERTDCRSDQDEACHKLRDVLSNAVSRGREIRRAPATTTSKDVTATAELPGGLRTVLRSDSKNGMTILDEFGASGQEVPGTKAKLTAVVVDPTKQRIATVGHDGTLRIRSAIDGSTPRLPWVAHTGGVSAVVFDAWGERLLTSGADGELKVWDHEGKQVFHTAAESFSLPANGANVTSLAWCFSREPEAERIAVGCSDDVVRVWSDNRGWSELAGHFKTVLAVAFAPETCELVSGAADGTVRLWLWPGGDGSEVFFEDSEGASDNEITSLAFSPNKPVLAGGDSGHNVLLWDLESRQARRLGRHGSGVRDVAFHPSGDYLASGGRDNLVKLWKVDDKLWDTDDETGDDRWLYRSIGGYERYVTSVSFSNDGSLLVTGSFGGTVKLVEGGLSKPVRELDAPHHELTALALTSDGSHLASGSSDGTVSLWEWNEKTQRYARPIPTLTPARQAVTALVFASGCTLSEESSEGCTFAEGRADGSIRVWHEKGGKLDKPVLLHGHPEAILELAFDDEATRVTSRGADGTERRWDLSDEGDNPVDRACSRLGSVEDEVQLGLDPSRLKRARALCASM